MRRWQANLLLLIAGSIWGMGFVAQANAMESIGPFLFVSLRFTAASLVVLPFAIREMIQYRKQPCLPEQARLPSVQMIGKFSLIGLMLFLGMALQQLGLLSTTVTNSGFLTGLYVVFTPVLGVVLYRQAPHPIVWFTALLALTGIFLLSGGRLSGLVVGDYLTIISAIFWGLHVTFIARYVLDYGFPLTLSLIQFVVTALLAGGFAAFREPWVLSSVITALPDILYAGVFASGLAFSLQVIAQGYTTAAQAAVFLSSEAPFAALFGYLFREERIAAIGFAGCALILLAMLLVELVPLWTKRRQGVFTR